MGCSGNICSAVVLFMGCTEMPAPPWFLPKLPQAAGSTSALTPGQPPPHSSFSHLGLHRIVSHTFPPLIPHYCAVFYPFLNTFSRGAASFADGHSFRQHQVYCRASWNQLSPAQGKPWPLPTEATHAALVKTLPC